MVSFILLDIEGTTTAIDFVHKTLFPYAAKCLEQFVKEHQNQSDVSTNLQSVQETVLQEEGREISGDEIIQTLLHWIQTDRKHTALKSLQGLIWQEGYEKGEYQGHVYEDVPPALETWKQQGIGLGIYSSGSIFAQKLLFGYSTAGDLTGYFSHYFDTTVGGKKEKASYEKISQILAILPQQILFLSDMQAELDAASEVGLQVMRVERDHNPETFDTPCIRNFAELKLESKVI